jgi:hypothetical protein
MAWKSRGIRRYYYRNRRVGATVKTEYIGGGLAGPVAALVDVREREKREERREAWRRQFEEQVATDRQIDELGAQVQDLVTAFLLADGCHQHKRQWRRQRGE